MSKKHMVGLICPDCGHEWPGYAAVGRAYEFCPVCGDGVEDLQLARIPSGRPHEGSRVVPGCDRHCAALPCPFCSPESAP